tara:strand:- start:532 stop:699 length:168 start_codon:yes stop_codon:yes gene_type:complete
MRGEAKLYLILILKLILKNDIYQCVGVALVLGGVICYLLEVRREKEKERNAKSPV